MRGSAKHTKFHHALPQNAGKSPTTPLIHCLPAPLPPAPFSFSQKARPSSLLLRVPVSCPACPHPPCPPPKLPVPENTERPTNQPGRVPHPAFQPSSLFPVIYLQRAKSEKRKGNPGEGMKLTNEQEERSVFFFPASTACLSPAHQGEMNGVSCNAFPFCHFQEGDGVPPSRPCHCGGSSSCVCLSPCPHDTEMKEM